MNFVPRRCDSSVIFGSLYNPPRSILYSIQPIGIGTPHTESLISYLTRLANAHGYNPRDLLSRALTLPRRGRLPTGIIYKMNGACDYAKMVVKKLEFLTGRSDLRYLTYLPWEGIFNDWHFPTHLSSAPIQKALREKRYLPLVALHESTLNSHSDELKMAMVNKLISLSPRISYLSPEKTLQCLIQNWARLFCPLHCSIFEFFLAQAYPYIPSFCYCTFRSGRLRRRYPCCCLKYSPLISLDQFVEEFWTIAQVKQCYFTPGFDYSLLGSSIVDRLCFDTRTRCFFDKKIILHRLLSVLKTFDRQSLNLSSIFKAIGFSKSVFRRKFPQVMGILRGFLEPAQPMLSKRQRSNLCRCVESFCHREPAYVISI